MVGICSGQLLRGQRHAGILIAAGTHGAFGEDPVLGDPIERLFEHILGIRLEDQALARPPAARIHHVMKARGEFFFVIVRIEVGA